MVTTLSEGDTIHFGESATLTLLAIEGDLIRFGVESSRSAGRSPGVLIERHLRVPRRGAGAARMPAELLPQAGG
jgi:hypothetical protein